MQRVLRKNFGGRRYMISHFETTYNWNTTQTHTNTDTPLKSIRFFCFFFIVLNLFAVAKGPTTNYLENLRLFLFRRFLILICCVCALLFFGWFVYVWCIAMLITLLDCADCPLRATSSSSKKQIFLVQGVKQKKKTQTTYWQDTPNVW